MSNYTPEYESPEYLDKVHDKLKLYNETALDKIITKENWSKPLCNYYYSLLLRNPFEFNKSIESAYFYLLTKVFTLNDKIKNDTIYGLNTIDILYSLKNINKYNEAEHAVDKDDEEYHIWVILIELLENKLL